MCKEQNLWDRELEYRKNKNDQAVKRAVSVEKFIMLLLHAFGLLRT